MAKVMHYTEEERRKAIRQNVRKWQKLHPDQVLESSKQSRAKLRLNVLLAYGGKCICCGETIVEFLQLDHVNNDGKEHRRQISNGLHSGSRVYKWAKDNSYPPSLQILCGNCHNAKTHYGGCPHQKEKNNDKL